ncbi:MAG: hydrogenase expression/formation protein HypE [Candidatus Zapsychrus exili]|nr:hydrogenase expression/formation protein HypE [Candidatus Zapsychrus exili]
MIMNKNFNITCPIPISDYPRVLLAHGSGGKLMQRLIDEMFIKTFGSNDVQHDATTLSVGSDFTKIAFTTDSYVVNPLFFPGGDIGSLAVYGTVNDLAVSGARAKYLSVGFILEEGLEMETLWRIVQSMKAAADKCDVKIVTGDTKVVDRGKGDGIFINTSGIGFIGQETQLNAKQIKSGDVVIVNGDIGRHGVAIMAQREGLKLESEIESDAAPVGNLVFKLLDAGIKVNCMRDLTRGGLASALNELAESAQLAIAIDENKLVVRDDVRGICEILGLDPTYVACEGRFVCFVDPKDADIALKIMQADFNGKNASIIGEVKTDKEAIVTIKSLIGTERILDMIVGQQLPRIC